MRTVVPFRVGHVSSVGFALVAVLLAFSGCTARRPVGLPGRQASPPAGGSAPIATLVDPTTEQPGAGATTSAAARAAHPALSLPLLLGPRRTRGSADTAGPSRAPGNTSEPEAEARHVPEGCDPATAYRDGPSLAVDGRSFAFLGVNAQYFLEPEFPEDRVEPALAALAERRVTAVRIWFLPGYDPDRLERTLDAGARQGIRFIVALDDNVPKGPTWLFGDDDELRYRPHLTATVERFRDRPEILMWEPTNEANCGDQYSAACIDTIEAWLTMASRLIKQHDPCHLVNSGLIGAGNYEPDRVAYRQLHGQDAVDVLSVHRGVDEDRLQELATAEELDAPIVYGEIYDLAYDEGCGLLEEGKVRKRRAERVKDDFRNALRDGVDGYVLWDFAAGTIETPEGDVRHYCGVFGYELTDPVWQLMAEAGLPPPVPWQ